MSSSRGTALVTGASSGIGAVYADRLARRGHDLVLVARDGARLQALADRLRAETGRAVEVLAADLTDGAAIARVAARLAAADVTLLVNNAGTLLRGAIHDNADAALVRIVTLNVTAPTLLAAAAARAFVARGGGAIVNIASIVAVAPELLDGVYPGTKAFVLNLTQGMAAHAGDTGLYVQAVLPGPTRSELWERSGQDMSWIPDEMIMTAEDLVDAALVGFDRRETVTIPSLADERQWTAFEEARLAMAPNLSRRAVAERYRRPVPA